MTPASGLMLNFADFSLTALRISFNGTFAMCVELPWAAT
jgi:hypothetical protein